MSQAIDPSQNREGSINRDKRGGASKKESLQCDRVEPIYLAGGPFKPSFGLSGAFDLAFLFAFSFTWRVARVPNLRRAVFARLRWDGQDIPIQELP